MATPNQPAVVPTTVPDQKMSLSWQEIKQVQTMIERCMQQYMTQAEIISTLQNQADVQPSLTCLVWQKLEEQNVNFFYSYNVMLRLKDQLISFNYLADQQTRLMNKLNLTLKDTSATPTILAVPVTSTETTTTSTSIHNEM
mmetsp:Transcript_42191/g.54334  ORF Transcript_42191/g.54334 Transcript_42191/m.54334 type:complete len:141 (+) Transcript_42191:1457-1879(+)